MIVLVKALTLYISMAVEIAAAVIVALAAIESMTGATRVFFRRVPDTVLARETIRLQLGRWLVLALELELAADILRTAVAPTWNDIGQLAAIIVLRTVLNYFLQRESRTPATIGE
jgi:uncharacterized membrane protein